MDDVFVVLVSYGTRLIDDSVVTNILNISYSEETAWTSIESNINANYTNNEFGNPYINIDPKTKFVQVSAPICCGCDSANTIYTHRDYKILKRKITN